MQLIDNLPVLKQLIYQRIPQSIWSGVHFCYPVSQYPRTLSIVSVVTESICWGEHSDHHTCGENEKYSQQQTPSLHETYITREGGGIYTCQNVEQLHCTQITGPPQ